MRKAGKLAIPLVALAVLLAAPSIARAQEDEPHRRYVFGLGGVGALDLGARSWSGGGNAFFEMEAIEHWLSIEAGLSVVRAKTGGELSYDLLLKKPFPLRPDVELMVGLGPEVVQTFGAGPGLSYYGVEAVLDFMFWPTKNFGVWVAPTWDVVVRDRATLTASMTAGPMVGW
jgi:hypothetical protein